MLWDSRDAPKYQSFYSIRGSQESKPPVPQTTNEAFIEQNTAANIIDLRIRDHKSGIHMETLRYANT